MAISSKFWWPDALPDVNPLRIREETLGVWNLFFSSSWNSKSVPPLASKLGGKFCKWFKYYKSLRYQNCFYFFLIPQMYWPWKFQMVVESARNAVAAKDRQRHRLDIRVEKRPCTICCSLLFYEIRHNFGQPVPIDHNNLLNFFTIIMTHIM